MKPTLVLVSIVDSISIDVISSIWATTSKFASNYDITLKLFSNKALNSHQLSMLLYKYEYDGQTFGLNVQVETYEPVQMSDVLGVQVQNVANHWQEFLKHQNVKYVIYFTSNCLFSQQPINELFVMIDNQINWYTEGEQLFGKDLQTAKDWVQLKHLYPLIKDQNSLKEVQPIRIGIFDSAMICSDYFKSWVSFFKTKFINGEKLYL